MKLFVNNKNQIIEIIPITHSNIARFINGFKKNTSENKQELLE